MGSRNKVVAVLVVWAVVVTVWMVLLSTGGGWTHCRDVRAELGPEWLHAPHRSPEHEVSETEITSLKLSDEATTNSNSTVLDEKLSTYFSRIMHRPPPPEWPWEETGNGSSKEQENCTAVLLTHQKEASILIRHYCKVHFLQKILVVWNDVDRAVPYAIRRWERRCTDSEVKVIQPSVSKPINRYLVWKDIETDCKLRNACN